MYGSGEYEVGESVMKKSEVILSKMLKGQEVELGGYTYRLFSEGQSCNLPNGAYIIPPGDYFLGCRVHSEKEKKYVGFDMTLPRFLVLASQLSDADVVLSNRHGKP